MRKNLLVLCASSIFILTACGGKSLTKDEAKQYAKENYTLEKASKAYSGGERTTVTDVTKSTGVFASLFEVGKTTEKKEITSDDLSDCLLTETLIENFATNYKNATYSLNGSKMTLSGSLSVEDSLKEQGTTIPEGAKVSGTGASESINTNEVGLITKQASKASLGFSYTTDGVTTEGEIELTITVDFVYTAK